MSLSKGLQIERPQLLKPLKTSSELGSLRQKVEEALGAKSASIFKSLNSEGASIAFTLLFAHLLRIPLSSSSLQSGELS